MREIAQFDDQDAVHLLAIERGNVATTPAALSARVERIGMGAWDSEFASARRARVPHSVLVEDYRQPPSRRVAGRKWGRE